MAKKRWPQASCPKDRQTDIFAEGLFFYRRPDGKKKQKAEISPEGNLTSKKRLLSLILELSKSRPHGQHYYQ